MAELPDLGKHCSKENCNQLDFLPFQCIHCKLTFCKEHFPVAHHECSNAPNNTIDDTSAVKSPSLYRCSFKDCNAGELTPIICAECTGQFCLKHRHQVDHSCSKYEAPKDGMTKTREHIASLAVMKQKASVVPKKPRNAKSQRTAAKVQLMKLKMKSAGNKSLPQDEKVFFQILLPKTIERRTENVFVSGKWSMGKVIDTVSTFIFFSYQCAVAHYHFKMRIHFIIWKPFWIVSVPVNNQS